MKLFVVVFALLAVAAAKPSGIAAPLVYTAAPSSFVAAPLTIAAPISSQFHAQDELGQYSYGYANGLSAKSEARSADGLTVGGYRYVDAEGKLQSVEYSSDGVHGFRVAATNLPVAPQVPKVPALAQPVPVQDTPEVAEAKARHLAALEHAKVRSLEVVAPVQSFSTIVLPSVTPVISAAPIIAVKSAEVSPTEEAKSTVAPAVEVPIIEAKSAATPAAEVKSEVASPAAVSPLLAPATTVAVKSFVTPTLSVGAAPLVAAPVAYGYSINSIPSFGFSSTLLAQPAITSYTVPFGAQLLAAPVTGSIAPAQRGTATKEAEKSSE